MGELLTLLGIVAILHFVIGKYPEPLKRSKNPKKEVWEAIGFTVLVSIAGTIILFITPAEAIINKTPQLEFFGSLALSPFIFVIPLLYVLRVSNQPPVEREALGSPLKGGICRQESPVGAI